MPSLRLKEVGGVLRHVLDERLVHAGNVLEFYSMGEGVWLLGRYELGWGSGLARAPFN